MTHQTRNANESYVEMPGSCFHSSGALWNSPAAWRDLPFSISKGQRFCVR